MRPMVWEGYTSRIGIPIDTANKYDQIAKDLSVKGLKVDTIPVHVARWIKHDTTHAKGRAEMFRDLVTQYKAMPGMLEDFLTLYRQEQFALATGETYGNVKVDKLPKEAQRRWATVNSNYVSKLSQVVKAFIGDSKSQQRVIKAFTSESAGNFDDRVRLAQGKETVKRGTRSKKATTPLQAEKVTAAAVQDKGDWNAEESIDHNLTNALNHIKTLSNVEHVLKHLTVIISKRKVDKEYWIADARAKAIHDGLVTLLSTLPGPIA